MFYGSETRASIANPPNSAQLEGAPTILPSYIRRVAGQGTPEVRTPHEVKRTTPVNHANPKRTFYPSPHWEEDAW